MLRSEVVQSLLNRHARPRLLEIGSFEGATFHAVRAAYKVAVDPSFRFQVPQDVTWDRAYHEVTSDFYFSDIIRESEQFDVIFLDGLHTFEQTLRDLLNAVAYLAPGGTILIDDILPSSFNASIRDQSDFDRLWRLTGQGDASWMGDVFHLLFFIQSFLQPFSYATVADNHGQLVCWRARRGHAAIVDRRLSEVTAMTYADVLLRREDFNIRPMAEILALLPPVL